MAVATCRRSLVRDVCLRRLRKPMEICLVHVELSQSISSTVPLRLLGRAWVTTIFVSGGAALSGSASVERVRPIPPSQSGRDARATMASWHGRPGHDAKLDRFVNFVSTKWTSSCRLVREPDWHDVRGCRSAGTLAGKYRLA